MFNWKWADFWGFLKPGKKRQAAQQDEPRTHPRLPLWGTAAGKVAWVAVVVAIFGTVAFLLIPALVEFFGGIFGQLNDPGLE